VPVRRRPAGFAGACHTGGVSWGQDPGLTDVGEKTGIIRTKGVERQCRFRGGRRPKKKVLWLREGKDNKTQRSKENKKKREVRKKKHPQIPSGKAYTRLVEIQRNMIKKAFSKGWEKKEGTGKATCVSIGPLSEKRTRI